MYYEEQWIEGALCWRTSPYGAWTRYTANELAHRYESAEKRAAAAQATVEALQRERDAILKAINDSTYTDRRGRRCMAFKQLEEVIGKIEGSGKGGPTGRVDALSECARCHGPMPVQTTGGSRKRYCSTTCKDSDRDPVKLASRLALKTAVNRGEIVRPDSCQRCGKSEALIEGHHHDYAKPLDVQWLCPKCHAATHMEMRANGQNI